MPEDPITANSTAFDAPPPGVGFVTTTGKLPAVVRSAVVSEIVSRPVPTYVGVWAIPLKVTVEFAKNPVPLMVSVCGTAPAGSELGDSEDIEGTGLVVDPGIVKLTAPEVAPTVSGFVTVTGKTHALSSSAAGRTAVRSFRSTNVVVRAVPLKFTTESGTKPDPVSVRLKPGDPAFAAAGLN